MRDIQMMDSPILTITKYSNNARDQVLNTNGTSVYLLNYLMNAKLTSFILTFLQKINSRNDDNAIASPVFAGSQ